MVKSKHPDEFRLSTGRIFYANCHIIGLSPDGRHPREGYDGGIDTSDWTSVEKKELAEYMIALWKKWAGI